MTDTLYRLDLPAFCHWDAEEREEDFRITVTECPLPGLFDRAGRLTESVHQLHPSRIAALTSGILQLTLAYEESYRLNE
jgi:hypothetical protein